MTGRLVCGVGINDADYAVTVEEVISRENGKRTRRRVWICPLYRAWEGMLRRCYSSALHAQRPTYAGCSVAAEWRKFSAFRSWMVKQNWEGNHLDKDILRAGNKVYGPETCVFVSRSLNNFLIDAGAARGEWPIGVSLHKRNGKFRAECRNPITGRNERIGLFTCPDEAHMAWLKRKRELANLLAEQQTDQRIADALRARYASAEGK